MIFKRKKKRLTLNDACNQCTSATLNSKSLDAFTYHYRGIVLEYTKDGRKIHENWLGVVTNSPPYDWHMSNLQNYANLQRNNIDNITIGGMYFM